jgi:hypothetical protein
MKKLSSLVAFTVAIGGLAFTELPASAAAADITGTWEVTIHYSGGDHRKSTYVLKQDGEKVTGTYHGLLGPADVTGTVKGNDVTMSVTVQSLTTITAHFSGKLTSATKMSGTVTGTSAAPSEKWSAEKRADPKAEGAGTLTIANQYGGGVYYLTIERGSKGGPVRIRASSRTEPVKRLEEGKMYGTTVLIADGGSKSYSLEAGSYYVTLNFYKPGRGVYTMTDPPIVITADQTRTLTITADGILNY